MTTRGPSYSLQASGNQVFCALPCRARRRRGHFSRPTLRSWNRANSWRPAHAAGRHSYAESVSFANFTSLASLQEMEINCDTADANTSNM